MSGMNLVERAALRLLAEGSSPVHADASGTVAIAALRAPAQAVTGARAIPLSSGREHQANNTSAPPGRARRSRSASFDPARRREFGLDAWMGGRSRLTEEFRVIKGQLLQQVA